LESAGAGKLIYTMKPSCKREFRLNVAADNGVFARNDGDALNELDDCHWRGVAAAEAGADDAGVATVSA
jgi:hypothetical protein